MKLQNLFPYNSTIVGLDGIYHTVGDDSYYINSVCIQSEDQIVTSGKTYLLMESTIFNNSRLYPIILLDVFYRNGNVYLLVQDLLTKTNHIIHHRLDRGEIPCRWELIDLDYYVKIINERVIKSYCEKN